MVEKNLEVLYTLSNFVRISELPRVPHPKRIAYVSDKMLKYAGIYII